MFSQRRGNNMLPIEAILDASGEPMPLHWNQCLPWSREDHGQRVNRNTYVNRYGRLCWSMTGTPFPEGYTPRPRVEWP